MRADLSHDECVFMRNNGYGFLYEFPMIVTTSYFGGDSRALPRKPEVASDIAQLTLADWLIPEYRWWCMRQAIFRMQQFEAIPLLWPRFSMNYDRYKPRWSDGRTNIHWLCVHLSVSSQNAANSCFWWTNWAGIDTVRGVRSSASLSRSTRKADLFLEWCLEPVSSCSIFTEITMITASKLASWDKSKNPCQFPMGRGSCYSTRLAHNCRGGQDVFCICVEVVWWHTAIVYNCQ